MEDEGHHRAWRGTLMLGDWWMAVLPAGATVEVRGAGEHAEVAATRQAWLRFEAPLNAGLRAAQ
eukprot:11219510-Lingulodinium_polyedra.AAC.1